MKKANYPVCEVSFLDHNSTRGDNLATTKCRVVGWLIKEDDDALYVATWITDEDVQSNDTEVFTILKKVVSDFKRIT